MLNLNRIGIVRLSGLIGVSLGIVIISWPNSTPSTSQPRETKGMPAATMGPADASEVAELSPKTKAFARIVEAGVRELDAAMATRALKAIPAVEQTKAFTFALNELKDQRFFEADSNTPQANIERPLRFIATAFESLKSLDESQHEAKARWGSFLALERAKLGGNESPSVSEVVEVCLEHAAKMPTTVAHYPNPLLRIWNWLSNLVLPAALGGLGVVVSKLFTTAADEAAKAYVKAIFLTKKTDVTKTETTERRDDTSTADGATD